MFVTELQEQLEKQRKELGDQLQSKVEIFEMYNMKMQKIEEEFFTQSKKEL